MKGEVLSWTHSSSPQRGREARVNPQSELTQWPQANGPGETAPQLAQHLGEGQAGWVGGTGSGLPSRDRSGEGRPGRHVAQGHQPGGEPLMPRPLPTPPGAPALELLWAGVGGTPWGAGPWEAREASLFANLSAGGWGAAKDACLPAGASGDWGGGLSPQGVLSAAVTLPARLAPLPFCLLPDLAGFWGQQITFPCPGGN